MWTLKRPNPVKLIVGILAADNPSLQAALQALVWTFGPADLVSETWPFDKTDYYKAQAGDRILRRFISFEKPCGSSAKISESLENPRTRQVR